MQNSATGVQQSDTITESADGRTFTLQGTLNEDGAPSVSETVVLNANGTVTDTSSASNGPQAFGFSQARTQQFNTDGGQTIAISDSDGEGVLQDQSAITVSGNGLSTTTTTNFSNGGSETLSDVTVVNANGSRTETIRETASGGAILENDSTQFEKIVTTSADGRDVQTETFDGVNGGGTELEDTSIGADGSETITTTFINPQTGQAVPVFSPDGGESASVVTTISANGLVETETFGDYTITTTMLADEHGSYQWEETSASGAAVASGWHIVDANGIDTWTSNTSSGTTTVKIDLGSEDIAIGQAAGIYYTILGRAMLPTEQQNLVQFIQGGTLNQAQLANSLLSSAGLANVTGAASVGALIESFYQNAFGEAGPANEEAQYVNDVVNGVLSLGQVAADIAETADAELAGDGLLEGLTGSSAGTPTTVAQIPTAAQDIIDAGAAYEQLTGDEIGSLPQSASAVASATPLNIFSGLFGGATPVIDPYVPVLSPEIAIVTRTPPTEVYIDIVSNESLEDVGPPSIVVDIQGSGNTITMEESEQVLATVDGSDTVVVASNLNEMEIAGSGDSIYVSNDDAVFVGGSGNGISVNTGSGLEVNGSGNSISLSADDTLVLTDSSTSNQISVATDDTVIVGVGGTGNVISVASGAGATVDCEGNQINLASNDTVTVIGYSNGISLVSGDNATVNGTSNSISETSGATAFVNGDSNSATLASGAFLGLNGSNETVTATGATIVVGSKVLLSSGSSATVSGSGNLITASEDATLVVSGASDTATLASGDSIQVSGTNDTVNASDASVQVDGSGSTVTLNGSNNSINEAAGATLAVFGNGNSATLASGATIDLNGTGETVNGSSDAIDVGANSTATISGSSDSISLTGDDVVTVTGRNNIIIVEGSNDTITASNSVIGIESGVTGVTIDGTGNQVQPIVGNGTVVNFYYSDGSPAVTSSMDQDGSVAYSVYNTAGQVVNSGTLLAHPSSEGQWSSQYQYTDYYDASGNLNSVYAIWIGGGSSEGDTINELWSNGEMVYERYNDESGTLGAAYTDYYNSSGIRVSSFGSFDNSSGTLGGGGIALSGDTFSEEYNASGAVSTYTINDVTGNLGRSSTDFYNSSGQRTSTTGTYDAGNSAGLDGDTFVYTYNANGTVASYSVKDVANDKAWTSYTDSYDGDGNLLAETGVSDNGSTWVNVYDGTAAENVVNSATISIDPSNSATISGSGNTYTDYYDGSGQVIAESGTWTSGANEGDTWYDTFNSAGGLVSRQFDDAAGNAGGSYTAYYNSAGEIVSENGALDSGATAGDIWSEVFSANGTGATYSFDDLTGGNGGSYTSTRSYRGGVLTAQTATWTTGASAEDTFSQTYYGDSGRIASFTENDTANRYTWTSSSELYDDEGRPAVAYTTNDNGDTSYAVYNTAGQVVNSGTLLAHPSSSSQSSSGYQYTYYYDASGQLNSVYAVWIGGGSSEGDTVTELWNDGEMVYEHYDDESDTQGGDWTNYYSSSGVLVSTFGTFDNSSGTVGGGGIALSGDTFSDVYVNGTLSIATINDVTGNLGRSSTDFYNSSGQRTSTTGTYDSGMHSGDTFSVTYNANGTMATYSVDDVTGNLGFSYANHFNSYGQLVSQTGTYDSGALAGQTFSDNYEVDGTVDNASGDVLADSSVDGSGNETVTVYGPGGEVLNSGTLLTSPSSHTELAANAYNSYQYDYYYTASGVLNSMTATLMTGPATGTTVIALYNSAGVGVEAQYIDNSLAVGYSCTNYYNSSGAVVYEAGTFDAGNGAGLNGDTFLYTYNSNGTVASYSVSGNAGDNILSGGTTSAVLYGDGGYDTYEFGRGSGQDRIVNGAGSGATAEGELDIGAGVSIDQLWLQQSGNDLVVDIMGTHDQAVIANWFGTSPDSQLERIVTSDGSVIDSQISQLVQAMATYSANSAGFDPTTVAQIPNDSTLQGAIAAAWHH